MASTDDDDEKAEAEAHDHDGDFPSDIEYVDNIDDYDFKDAKDVDAANAAAAAADDGDAENQSGETQSLELDTPANAPNDDTGNKEGAHTAPAVKTKMKSPKLNTIGIGYTSSSSSETESESSAEVLMEGTHEVDKVSESSDSS